MASGKLLRQLIKSGTEGNFSSFKEATEQVIQDERAKNHHLLANDLEKILYGKSTSSKNKNLFLESKLPKDRERNLPLVQIREPIRRWEDLILTDDTNQTLSEILEEHHRCEVLNSFGLKAANRLLFFGPPGCGKTLCAEVLASELALPLVIVRIDSVVSSFLGETAANLRQVFDFAEQVPSVVLFDEFDALAKERSDDSDHGELKRVVNAFLQMLDAYDGKSILIGATNHENILDEAVWRRFDEVLRFPLPDAKAIKQLLLVKLRGLRRAFDAESNSVTRKFDAMSHADIERVIRRAAKEMVLSGNEFLEERHITSALGKEEARKFAKSHG